MTSKKVPDRTGWLKTRHKAHKQRKIAKPVVSTAAPKRVKPKTPPKRRVSDGSLLDKVMPLTGNPAIKRDTPTFYGPIRCTIAWLYQIKTEDLRMNFHLKRIHPSLRHELFRATGKHFPLWPGMTIEDISHNCR